MNPRVKTAKPQPVRRRRVRGPLAHDPDTGETTELEPREVAVTGPEAEARCLLARLAPVYAQHVEFYAKEYAGSPEPTTPRERADAFVEHSRETTAETPARKLTWRHLSAVAQTDVQGALDLWERIKQEAREDVATGTYVSEAVYPNAAPFDRARQFAVREEMADGWKPQNGIEHTLIDMLALSYSLWLHWTGLAHTWATSFVEGNTGGVYDRLERTRGWKPPRVSEAEAVEQAHRLADSYNRQFLRTLRQLRDLRRYAPPVIVNNGGQVNVANQQVNLSAAD
jgi:hypothetical protein